MAENPLVRIPAAWPVLQQANALRRQAVGRVRSIDMIQWSDVPYGDGIAQRMHIWEMNDLAPRDGWPAVLLLHGGGWVEGSWQDFESLGPYLARKGLLVVAMNYRLGPEHRWPAQRQDVLAGLDFVHGQQVDHERVAVWGHSAGGHLALHAALLRPDLVAACVAVGAPVDLAALEGQGSVPLEMVFDPGQRVEASPLHIECAAPPPILHLHGSKDRVVDIAQAHAHQRRRGEAVDLIEVPDGDHGLRWPPMGAWRARRSAVDWLLTQLEMPERGSKWKARKKSRR